MVPTVQKQVRPALSGRSNTELEQVIKDRIQFAIKALNTDQPNLAALYIKRATENVQELRYKLAISKATVSTVGDLAALAGALREVFQPLVAVFSAIGDFVSAVFPAGPDDFALVGPK